MSSMPYLCIRVHREQVITTLISAPLKTGNGINSMIGRSLQQRQTQLSVLLESATAKLPATFSNTEKLTSLVSRARLESYRKSFMRTRKSKESV